MARKEERRQRAPLVTTALAVVVVVFVVVFTEKDDMRMPQPWSGEVLTSAGCRHQGDLSSLLETPACWHCITIPVSSPALGR
jgi:hypothetical protein